MEREHLNALYPFLGEPKSKKTQTQEAERAELVDFFQSLTGEYLGLTDVPPQIVYNGTSDALSINIWNAIVSDEAAIVDLVVEFNGYSWVVNGTSKRLPGDKTDLQVGMGLAMARALETVAAQFTRQATGRVKHNDDNHARRKGMAKAALKKAKTKKVSK